MRKDKFFNIGLSYLSPGENKLSHYIEMANDLYGKSLSIIEFDAEYHSSAGKKYKTP